MQHIKKIINNDNFFIYLITLILSTMFIGYALSSIAVGLFAFFSITQFFINKEGFQFDKALLVPLVLFAFLSSTILWTIDVNLTIKGIGRLATLAVIPISFYLIPKFTYEKRQLILRYFTYANIAYALFFLANASINYLKTKNLEVFTYHELVEVLDLNAIYVSTFFSISLCYLIGKSKKNYLDKFSIFLFINIIVLLSSKMIIGILIISLLLYLFMFKGLKSVRKLNKKTGIIIIIGVIVTISFTSKQIYNRLNEEKKFTKVTEVLTKEKFSKVYLWTGTSFRLFQLRLLKEQIQEEDIFWKGFGLFASRENLKTRHQNYNTYKEFHDYNYHNQYAQIMSETGVFGLLLLLFMLFTNFINANKSKDFLFFVFSILLIMLFFTESFLWVQRGVIFTAILYCLFNRTIYKRRQKKETI